jgi:hypothetical protein
MKTKAVVEDILVKYLNASPDQLNEIDEFMYPSFSR